MMNYKMEELLPLVGELSEKYTCKESTSISYEKAQQLMGAVIYCIQENEKQKEDSSGLVKTERFSAREAYKSGYELVIRKVMEAKRIFERLTGEFQSYGNYAYEDTVIHGMPEFFLHYNTRFYPQDHILTLDYPILESQDELCGIDRIYHYLSCIRLEQIFLNRLPYSYVVNVLCSFHEEYEELLINVCGIIWRNIMGWMLIGSTVSEDRFSKSDLEQIRIIVNQSSRQELEERFRYLTKVLIQHEYNTNRELQNYLESEVKNFAVELIHAAEYNCIDQIL